MKYGQKAVVDEMAATLLSSCLRTVPKAISSTIPKILFNPMPPTSFELTRLASKKAGGTSKNKRKRTRPKHRGLKQFDGSFVHKGEILATQYGLRFYPGENVIMEDNCTLVAAYDGIVIVSTEKLEPYSDSPLYTPVQNGAEIHKKFVSVIPTPLQGKFRLISQT